MNINTLSEKKLLPKQTGHTNIIDVFLLLLINLNNPHIQVHT